MVKYTPQQGDIIKVNLNPRLGHEQQGFRPVLVLNNNIVSKFTNVIIVAPISTTERKLPLYQKLPLKMKTKGVVLLDQIVTIDYNAREFRFVERITEELLDYLLNVTRRIFTK